MSWAVADIKDKVRKLTGRRSTSQLSEVNLLSDINNFYKFLFPQEAQVKEFQQHVEFDTVASVGTKLKSAIDDSITNVHGPVYVDGDQQNFWIDHELFFQQFPFSNSDEEKPTDILLYNQTLYIRPIPDDVYTIKLNSTVDTPDALVEEADTPDDEQWGAMIAYGTAIEILISAEQVETAAKIGVMYNYHRSLVRKKQLQQEPLGKRSAPSF